MNPWTSKNWIYCLYLHFIIHISNIKKNILNLVIKGIYLSKALTCMIFFLYKLNMLFYEGDGCLWPYCCMNNLYISHRLLHAPTYSFWAIRSMLISLFRVTSWFYTVCNIVTRWLNFGKKQLHEHELQLSDYNMYTYFCPNVQISGRKIYILHFFLTNFSRSKWKV